MAETQDWNELAKKAGGGDRQALEAIVHGMQDRVHRLAMRMLVNPDDALEATQEILILVITRLSTFRGESAFGTWVYRVATNYLLNAKKIASRDRGLTFDMFAADLEAGLVADPEPSAEDTVMLNELRIACTMAMLLCLDLKHRIAYVLGDILEFEHAEAAQILDISAVNFRKRLSRARQQILAFTAQRCGLANEQAKCSCPRRLPAALAQHRVDADSKYHSSREGPTYEDVVASVKRVEGDLRGLKLQAAIPDYPCPTDLGAQIARIVETRF